jgi:NADH-quinone oxidoreductase subunit M
MLVGLLFLYFQTPDRSFDIQSFYSLNLANDVQTWVFWLLFIAFAIKMPVFPFIPGSLIPMSNHQQR